MIDFYFCTTLLVFAMVLMAFLKTESLLEKLTCVIIFAAIILVTINYSFSQYHYRKGLSLENSSINIVQQEYDKSNEHNGLKIYLEMINDTWLNADAKVKIVSETDELNTDELRYSLGEYQEKQINDSKIRYVSYNYDQSISGFDEFGHSIPSRECRIEYRTNIIRKIDFDNISDKDLLEHGFYDLRDADCFKIDEET